MSITLIIRVRFASNTHIARYQGKSASATSGPEEAVRALLPKVVPAFPEMGQRAQVSIVQLGMHAYEATVVMPDAEDLRQEAQTAEMDARCVPLRKAAVAPPADPPPPPPEKPAGVSDTCQRAKSEAIEVIHQLTISAELKGYPKSRHTRSAVLDLHAPIDPFGRSLFGVDLLALLKEVASGFRPAVEAKIKRLEKQLSRPAPRRRKGARR